MMIVSTSVLFLFALTMITRRLFCCDNTSPYDIVVGRRSIRLARALIGFIRL